MLRSNLITSISPLLCLLAACVGDGGARSVGSAGDEEPLTSTCGRLTGSIAADEETVYYQENFEAVDWSDPVETARDGLVSTAQELWLVPRSDEPMEPLDEPMGRTITCTKSCGPGNGKCKARGCLPDPSLLDCSECECRDPWDPNRVCPGCTCTASITVTDPAPGGR